AHFRRTSADNFFGKLVKLKADASTDAQFLSVIERFPPELLRQLCCFPRTAGQPGGIGAEYLIVEILRGAHAVARSALGQIPPAIRCCCVRKGGMSDPAILE